MTCENGIVDIRWAIATFYNLLSQYHFLSAIRPCLSPQPTMRFAELIAKSLDARRIMPRLACAPADRGEKKPRVLGESSTHKQRRLACHFAPSRTLARRQTCPIAHAGELRTRSPRYRWGDDCLQRSSDSVLGTVNCNSGQSRMRIPVQAADRHLSRRRAHRPSYSHFGW
jgi:hypothetical protein